MKRTGPTNPILKKLIEDLDKLAEKTDIWKKVSKELKRPTNLRRRVNLSKINRFANGKEDLIIPGKVLSSGEIKKGLTIVSLSFSEKAIEKITSSGSKAILLKDYIKKNPKGSKTRIIG